MFEKAQNLVDEGKTYEALDLVLGTFDSLLCSGRFDLCNLMLADCPFNRILCADIIVGALMVTNAAKGKLKAREKFVIDATERLQQILGMKETARLMRGL